MLAFLLAIAPFMRVAQCESHIDAHAVNPRGYYGAWQFTDGTWHSVSGLPGHASDYSLIVQLEGAVVLQKRVGWHSTASWPVCGWDA